MKKKLFGILICTLLIAVPVISVAGTIKIEKINNYNNIFGSLTQPPIQWEKTYGNPNAGYGYFVQQTSDGGYIATGVIYITGGTDAEVYLVKTDANGNTLWSKTFGGASTFDCGYSVQQTTDGGYIIASNTTSFGAGDWDGWLIKTDFDPTGHLSPKNKILPVKYGLSQNYPNPFNPTTVISWQLPVSSKVKLEIFNLMGQKISTLLSASLLSGFHSVEWDASNLASGIYLYRLQAGEYVETRKMILLK